MTTPELPALPYESSATERDLEVMYAQVGRHMRGVHSIARRCACGNPAVVRTVTLLPGGTPFPTSLYLTLPSVVQAMSRLEADGEMVGMNEQLAQDTELREAYAQAHDRYIQRRNQLGVVEHLANTSAGGMPTRVKCLHALAGHSLAEGPGVNPIGDLALEKAGVDMNVCRCEEPGEFQLKPRRVAAIDCGTNSIRLLIADVQGGQMTQIAREMRVVRLGYGVDRTGMLDPEAIERTLAATREYAQLCRDNGVEQVRFVATSATRDAENRDVFVSAVKEILGVEVEVVPGEEEAQLSFRGAVSTLAKDIPGPHLVIDIGGGSTEFVLGSERAEQRISTDMGSVRLSERYLLSDPPSEAEVAAALAEIDRLLDEAAQAVDFSRVASIVGVAGTITTVTAYLLGLESYQPEKINGASFSICEIVAACREIAAAPREKRAAIKAIHPGRVDVIAAGCLIYARILERVADASGVSRAYTSESDILDGIALQLA
ncbi:DUF501 domain-containing protein [Dermabacteraceae bacterium P13128]